MLDNITAVFSKEGILFTLMTLFMSWIQPALELAFLLYFLVFVDYLIDMYLHLSSKGTKADLWSSITQPTISKLVWYTVLILVLHATQVHMFKGSVSAYHVLMALPISAELISIMKSIEERTGLKLITKLSDILDSWVGTKSQVKEEKGE